MQVEDRDVNPAVAPKYLQQDFTRVTPNQYLVNVAPHWHAEYIVEAVAADRRTAKLLRIRPGAPCLVLT
ncbi:MAG: UTRA domain-containing protein, partial [Terriglobales bacterium]